MDLTKRIIACLDIKDGQTVKGVQFQNMKAFGDPVAQAVRYANDGVDELVFLDISATDEQRKTTLPLIRRIAEEINIPFTVGGGISSIDDVNNLLAAGADKVSINTAAIRKPGLVHQLSRRFGSQCIVVAVDARRVHNEWHVFANGGNKATNIKVEQWTRTVADDGAGEILLTAIDNDGARTGFATQLTRNIATAVRIPVIASGGAGTMRDFAAVFTEGAADAALAAGVFHEGLINIRDLKSFLRQKQIDVR